MLSRFGHITLIIFAALSMHAPLALHAQSVYTLKVIQWDGAPVEDALVIFAPEANAAAARQVLTGKDGIAVFSGTGKVSAQISRVGFTPTVAEFHKPGERKTITLQSSKTVLTDLVVTGQFEETSNDKTVQRVRVLDRRRIDRIGAVNLSDLLSNELNIRISQDGALGSKISMMGIGGQNVKILIDGVPVIGRMDGNLDISQINLNNIERVELIEGPMSVIYGTDALGGVINLITKKQKKDTRSIRLNSYFESVGTYNFDGLIGGSVGRWQGSVSGGRNFFDGFSQDESKYVRWKQWKPKEQYFTNAQVRWSGKKQSHMFSLQYFDETLINRGNAVITPTSITGVDNYFGTIRYSNSLYSDFKFGNKATLNLINSYSYYSRTKNAYIKNLVNGSEQLSQASDDHDTAVFRLWMSRATLTTLQGKRFNSQLGYDINLEYGDGQRLTSSIRSIFDYAFFCNTEIKPVARMKINPGLRFIYNNRYGAPVVPSLNLKYDLTSNLTARATYAWGFRSPSLKELGLFFVDVNHNIRGNDQLKAERSHNINMNLTWLKTSHGGPDIKLEGSLFYNTMDNLISLAMVDAVAQLYSYVNIDHYITKGIYGNTELFWKRMTLSFGGSYTGRYNQLSSSSTALPFSYAPEGRANITYRINKTNTDLNLFVKYNGPLPGYAFDASNNLIQTKVDGYTLADFSVSQYAWSRKLQCVAGVKNLMGISNISIGNSTGGTHSSGSSMPVSMGRYFFTSIKILLEN